VAISPKDKLPKRPYLPDTRQQNPAPVSLEGQQGVRSLRNITDQILNTFAEVLPSNYVSEVPGPFYILQFQAAAEALARIQLLTEDVGLESDVDFARPEFLFQIIGSLVFPDSGLTKAPRGIPEIDGDLTYRVFLKRMFELLLQGATLETQEEGVGLLTDAVVEVLAKVDFSTDPNSAWGLADQHTFEVNLLDRGNFTDPATGEVFEGALGTGFPDDPIRLFRNNQRILRAIKPAKAIYEYRHLFVEAFGQLFVDIFSYEFESWYYEDYRKFCLGFKEISGQQGETLANRTLFADGSRDFEFVVPGSTLEIFSGPNAAPENGGQDAKRFGRYRVLGVLRLPFGGEAVERPYVTNPTGLTGNVTIADDGSVQDLAQDFSNVAIDESITIQDGPNAGTFRIQTLLGPNGGPNDGSVPAGSGVTSVLLARSIVQTQFQIPVITTGQSYRITLERLGVQTPNFVIGEDVSAQFLL